MNRKTIKTRTGAYHVTLPIRLVEELDETLDYKQSRSKMIANLIETYLQDGGFVGEAYSDKRLLAILLARFKPETLEWNTLKMVYDSLP